MIFRVILRIIRAYACTCCICNTVFPAYTSHDTLRLRLRHTFCTRLQEGEKDEGRTRGGKSLEEECHRGISTHRFSDVYCIYISFRFSVRSFRFYYARRMVARIRRASSFHRILGVFSIQSFVRVKFIEKEKEAEKRASNDGG